jgi:hypothetical protein
MTEDTAKHGARTTKAVREESREGDKAASDGSGSGCQHGIGRTDGSTRGGYGSPSCATGNGSRTGGRSHKRGRNSGRTCGYGCSYRRRKLNTHAGLNCAAARTRNKNDKGPDKWLKLEWKRGPEGNTKGYGWPSQHTSTLIDKKLTHYTHRII